MELTSEFFKYKNIEEYSKRNHIFLVRKKFHATGLKIKNEVAATYGSHAPCKSLFGSLAMMQALESRYLNFREFYENTRIAYYSRQSLSRALNKRRRDGTAFEWVGSGKDREGREGKEKRGRIRCDTWKGETNNSRLSAAKGFLRELGRNEMRSSYLYSRCKGLAQIAYYSRQSLSCSLNKRRRNGTAPRSWTLDTS